MSVSSCLQACNLDEPGTPQKSGCISPCSSTQTWPSMNERWTGSGTGCSPESWQELEKLQPWCPSSPLGQPAHPQLWSVSVAATSVPPFKPPASSVGHLNVQLCRTGSGGQGRSQLTKLTWHKPSSHHGSPLVSLALGHTLRSNLASKEGDRKIVFIPNMVKMVPLTTNIH